MVTSRSACCVALLLMMAGTGPHLKATMPSTAEAAEQSMRQFLAQGDEQHPYRAIRRIEATHGDSSAWVEAATEFDPATGFRYTITGQGGADHIRDKVLKAILDGEREMVARGELQRAALAPCNYEFQASGVDADGLAIIRLSPRRQERSLVAGSLFLRPVDGELVRVQGRLAKSPSFWIKDVDIVRTYERVGGTVMPVTLETTAQLRMFGSAKLRMTYNYSQIDGRPVQMQARR